MVIYNAPKNGMQQSDGMSSKDKKKEMEQWHSWANKCGDKLVDMGAPLTAGITLNPDGNSSDSNNSVVGYSILQAENMENAKSLMKDHPHLKWNADCGIEIHETVVMPEM